MIITSLAPSQLANHEALLLDVCEPGEHEAAHIPGATNVPLSRLDAEAKGLDPRQAYVLACRSGKRARTAAERLNALGFTKVSVLEGGIQGWEAAGMPVVRGSGVWSLERQVRTAAGALVLVGAALGTFVHPYAYGLSAFVGAGLVFAGVTDTCGMAMVLAKMPWNRGSGASCAVPQAQGQGA